MDGPVTTASNLRRGHKRPASDHLENEQRLAKRFNLLNLGEISIKFLLCRQAIESLIQIKPIKCVSPLCSLMLREIIHVA